MEDGFLVPGWRWRCQKGRLYFGHTTNVREADVKTFRPLSDFWGVDVERVYCAGTEVRGADPNTFRVLNRLYARDSHRVYTVKGPIPESDVATFEACGPTEHAFNTTNGHAKDAYRVYHTVQGGKASVVSGADPGTFISTGNGYGRDDFSVYFERTKLPGADPATWRHLRGPHSQSGKNAYVLGRRIREADGERLESLPILDIGEFWSRDGTSYYLGERPQDFREYSQRFSECFVFIGRVRGIALSWNRTHLLDDSEASWRIADHVRLSALYAGE